MCSEPSYQLRQLARAALAAWIWALDGGSTAIIVQAITRCHGFPGTEHCDVGQMSTDLRLLGAIALHAPQQLQNLSSMVWDDLESIQQDSAASIQQKNLIRAIECAQEGERHSQGSAKTVEEALTAHAHDEQPVGPVDLQESFMQASALNSDQTLFSLPCIW